MRPPPLISWGIYFYSGFRENGQGGGGVKIEILKKQVYIFIVASGKPLKREVQFEILKKCIPLTSKPGYSTDYIYSIFIVNPVHTRQLCVIYVGTLTFMSYSWASRDHSVAF